MIENQVLYMNAVGLRRTLKQVPETRTRTSKGEPEAEDQAIELPASQCLRLLWAVENTEAIAHDRDHQHRSTAYISHSCTWLTPPLI